VPSNHLLNMLSGGDLRSDGMADEVTAIVLANDVLFEELYAGLEDADEVVRGRTADALEKVGRSRPDLFIDRLPQLTQAGRSDNVAMVRWHMAMLLGHLIVYEGMVDQIYLALIAMLGDESAFTRSWAISSLAILGRVYPRFRDEIVLAISALQWDGSAAIKSRVRMALAALGDDDAPFPSGWCKSEHLTL
jgi:HEAT repeat protein